MKNDLFAKKIGGKLCNHQDPHPLWLLLSYLFLLTAFTNAQEEGDYPDLEFVHAWRPRAARGLVS